MNKDIDFSDWIGRSDTATPDLVTSRLIAAFEGTLGSALAQTEDAPAGLHWCLCPTTAHGHELGPDGHLARGGFLPPVPLQRRMWAGGQVDFAEPLKSGDEVRRSSRIKSIEWKSGRTGRMCFVTLAHSYVTERGVAILEDQNIVYRDAEATKAPPSEICRKEFDHTASVDIDTVMLFRYSALTFNAHRIHYDLRYAREVENYPDVVIHGPLQATLLLNFASKFGGCMPKIFAYRGTAPAFGTQRLKLGLQHEGKGKCTLSAIAENGVETMKATATW